MQAALNVQLSFSQCAGCCALEFIENHHLRN
jgi:hypothetical protein